MSGATVSFTITAASDRPLSYQWRFNGTILEDGDQITGSNGHELLIHRVTRANAGIYSVRIRNWDGTFVEKSAILTVALLGFLSVELDQNGQGQLQFQGEAGLPVTIGATTKFRDWIKLGVITNSIGQFRYTTPDSNLPYRFSAVLRIPGDFGQ